MPSSSSSSSSAVLNCPYSIQLGIQRSVDREDNSGSGQFANVWVSQSGGFSDDCVFVYQRHELNPETGVRGAFFSNIASPNDMEELPYGEPLDTDTATLLFRLNYVESFFQSREAVDTFLNDVQSDVYYLVTAMNQRCRAMNDPIYVSYP